MRRRYYGADRISEDKLTLYNPAKMRVERYRFRGATDLHALQHRRGRPGGSTLPPLRPRRRGVRRQGLRTRQLATSITWRAGCAGNLHAGFGGRGREDRGRDAARRPVPDPTRQRDPRGAELLFQVLTEREERASVATASNHPFSEWGETFSDPRLAAAVVDRLTFRAHIIETGTDSYRLRLSRAKKGSRTT